ncbi:hypothetical protein [Methylobacterium flocculans]|uniref:hypothetical protein n=1 Tax=Methylobacterium flocculans TaxID=2984843 RepID=UPI0021F2CA5E|nr:hypothetical protein [Methylobacterium sp. FF17]
MLVYIVKVECQPNAGGGKRRFWYAVRAMNETWALASVSQKMGFDPSTVSSSGAAEHQETYKDLKLGMPVMVTFAAQEEC